MRKLFYLSIVAITVVITSCGGSKKPTPSANSLPQISDTSTVKKYGIKSGIVTYESSIAGFKQKVIVYFDHFGIRECRESYNEYGVQEVFFSNGKELYTLVVDKKTAYKRGPALRGTEMKVDWNEISKNDSDKMARKLPPIIILGKNCDTYSYTEGGVETQYAGWNGILLQMKVAKSNFEYKAVNFQENVIIPVEKFLVPEGFTVLQGSF
jgi:hypothetical protein